MVSEHCLYIVSDIKRDIIALNVLKCSISSDTAVLSLPSTTRSLSSASHVPSFDQNH